MVSGEPTDSFRTRMLEGNTWALLTVSATHMLVAVWTLSVDQLMCGVNSFINRALDWLPIKRFTSCPFLNRIIVGMFITPN